MGLETIDKIVMFFLNQKKTMTNFNSANFIFFFYTYLTNLTPIYNLQNNLQQKKTITRALKNLRTKYRNKFVRIRKNVLITYS